MLLVGTRRKVLIKFFSLLCQFAMYSLLKLEVNMFVQVGFLVRICKMRVESVQSEMRVPVIGTKN